MSETLEVSIPFRLSEEAWFATNIWDMSVTFEVLRSAGRSVPFSLHLMNMPLIFWTPDVSKPAMFEKSIALQSLKRKDVSVTLGDPRRAKSIDCSEEHPSNILAMLLTFDVLKSAGMMRFFREEHSWNIPSIVSTFETSRPDKSTDSSRQSPENRCEQSDGAATVPWTEIDVIEIFECFHPP